MKANMSILLIAWFLVFSPAVISQQNPEAVWSILSIGETDQKAGIPSPFLPLESSDDIRIHPTTNTTQSEMSVAVSPLNNHIILVSANATDFPVTTIYGTGAYWSSDGGNTWQGFDQPPTGNNHGDPAAVIDLNGYFYIGSIAPNYGQGIMRSTNGGNSWVYFQVSNPSSPFGLLDKNHLTVDNNPNSPHTGNLYAAWTDFDQPSRPVEFARSTDRGEHWINEQNISANEFSQGVNLQTGPNGYVYATWAIPQTTTPFTERALGFNKSTNGGQNWGIPTRAIENIHGIRAPNNGPYFQPYNIRANSFPSMAVSQITGHIYIVWCNVGVPGINTGDPDIYLIKSTDGGSSWTASVRVNDDPVGNGANQWFPWITVDPLYDDISIVFYDGRNHIGSTTAEITVAHSNDGGATFENFIVSDTPFTVGPLPGLGGNYNGDYIGIVARGGRAYPTWNAQVPSTNSQAWMSPVSYTIVEQRRENGSLLAGTLVGRWEGGPNFVEYQVPISFRFTNGSTEVLRGSQDLVYNPTEKYHHWNEYMDVTNHHIFTIEPNTFNLTSWFKPTHSGVVIRNDLLSAPNQNGGIVEFKDPWLIDYPDPQYGYNLRNQGMAAPFKPQNSPFNPNTNLSGPGSEYKGVFLNQDPEFDPDIPNYTLRVPQTQYLTFHGQSFPWHFLNWQDDFSQAEVQDLLQTTSPVVFKQANAEIRARYKGYLASSPSPSRQTPLRSISC